MKNYSLQASIIFGFLFVGLLVLIVALVGWNSNSRLSEHINVIANNAFPSVVNLKNVHEAQIRVAGAIRSQLTSDFSSELKKEELENLTTSLKHINEGFEAYRKLPYTSEENQIYQTVNSLFQDWQNNINEFLRLNEEFLQFNINDPKQVEVDILAQNKASSPEFGQARDAAQTRRKMGEYVINTIRPAFEKSEAALIKLTDYNQKVEDSEVKIATTDISQTTFWVLVGMLIGPLTAIVFGIYFSSIITKSLGVKINHVVAVAEQIAGGDLTSHIQAAESKDEIGKLQNAFRTMVQNLNSIISQVNQTGIKVTSSATQIAAAGKQLEATFTEQAASTNEVSATSGEIAATSGELVKAMDHIAQKAQATASAASYSQADLMQMSTAMRQLAEATTSISSTLGVMNEKANNINSVVTTITKVADQTNLLSLNAAIEAEKAGEYGAGFAVVAREIRRLADQTAVATLEIEQMVKEMQSSVSTSVMEMDKFHNQVSEHVEQVSRISGQIAQVIDQVQSLTPDFEDVSHSMDQQFEGAQQISIAIAQLSEASHQTLATLQETNRAVEQLDDASLGLQKIISRFKVKS